MVDATEFGKGLWPLHGRAVHSVCYAVVGSLGDGASYLCAVDEICVHKVLHVSQLLFNLPQCLPCWDVVIAGAVGDQRVLQGVLRYLDYHHFR